MGEPWLNIEYTLLILLHLRSSESSRSELRNTRTTTNGISKDSIASARCLRYIKHSFKTLSPFTKLWSLVSRLKDGLIFHFMPTHTSRLCVLYANAKSKPCLVLFVMIFLGLPTPTTPMRHFGSHISNISLTTAIQMGQLCLEAV